MRQQQRARLGALWVLVLITMALLSACGGSDSGGDDKSVAEASGAGQSAATLTPSSEEPLAARVNDQPIPLTTFQRERDRRTVGLTVPPASQAAFEASVLDAMMDEALIAQAAAKEGIVVGEDEIDAEIAVQSELALANGQSLETIITAQLYTMDEYRTMLRNMLLVQKLSDVVAVVPPYAEQVHSRHILVADETAARALIAQIQGGADFAEMAFQYSLDESSRAGGGDLGWVTRGVLLQIEVEDAIFALEPGQLAPEPVHSSLGYHVVQTLERVLDRPLTQAEIAEQRQAAFLTWLAAERAAATIERFIGDNAG